MQSFIISVLLGCIFLIEVRPDPAQTSPNIHDVSGVFLRAKINDGALDANGAGNDYRIPGAYWQADYYTVEAKWKWVTLNNATPPYRWLKWRFDTPLLKVGTPPDLYPGATGQVCLECNGSSENCEIIVAACHGGKSQHWRAYLDRFTSYYNTIWKKFFLIESRLHPGRCISLYGILTTTKDLAKEQNEDSEALTPRNISGLGYKLSRCTPKEEQLFYIDREGLPA